MLLDTDTVHEQVPVDNRGNFRCLGLNVTISTCFQSCLIGIVVPDPEALPEFAAKLGVKGSYEDICKNPVRGFMVLDRI